MWFSKRKRVEVSPEVKVAKVRGYEISFVANSEIEAYRFETYESKEPETLDWLDALVQEGDTFYDIGANIGLYSLYAAQRVGSSGRVYSFEPESQNFVSLNKNIIANDLRHAITVPIALTDRFQLNWFHISGVDFFTGSVAEESTGGVGSYVSGAAMHSFGEEAPDNSSIYKYMCFGTSLDWLVSNEEFEIPNHIKIDVDGIEQQIIDGAGELLGNQHVKSLLIEINEGQGEIVDAIQRAGLRKDEALSSSNNWVFVR